MSYHNKKVRLRRTFLIIINLLILVVGSAVVGVGSWMIYDDLQISALLGSHLFLMFAMLFVASGSTIAIVSLLGCIAVCRPKRALLYMYAGLTILPLLLVLAAGILALVYKTRMEEIVEEELEESIGESYTDKEKQEAWDKLQEKFFCCGVDGYMDWKDNPFCAEKRLLVVPARGSVSNYGNEDPGDLDPNKFLHHLDYEDSEDLVPNKSPHRYGDYEYYEYDDILNTNDNKITKQDENTLIRPDSFEIQSEPTPASDSKTSGYIDSLFNILEGVVPSAENATTPMEDSVSRRKRSESKKCKVPKSCCRDMTNCEKKLEIKQGDVYDRGCLQVLHIEEAFIYMGSAGIGISVCMFLTLMLSYCLTRDWDSY